MPRRICVMGEFCPLCLRGGIPRYSSESCSSIDFEQAECSRTLKGLPLLNLGAPGRPCINPCRITCVVCGHAAIFACEPGFTRIIDALEQYESDLLEIRAEVVEGLKGFSSLGKTLLADLERRFRRLLSNKWGLGWHSRFQRITHLRCIRRASCGCDLSFCTQKCEIHGECRVLKRPPDCEVAPPTLIVKIPELELANRQMVFSKNELQTQKCTWLAKPSMLAAPPAKPEPTAVFASASKKPKPSPPKPDERLQAAAAGCKDIQALLNKNDVQATVTKKTDLPQKKRSSKITNTARLTPPCARLGAWVTVSDTPKREKGVPIKPEKKTELERPSIPLTKPPPPSSFSRFRHFRDFDPFQHGYWQVNRQSVYRFPDGRQVPVEGNVHVLTENGELEPE